MNRFPAGFLSDKVTNVCSPGGTTFFITLRVQKNSSFSSDITYLLCKSAHSILIEEEEKMNRVGLK